VNIIIANNGVGKSRFLYDIFTHTKNSLWVKFVNNAWGRASKKDINTYIEKVNTLFNLDATFDNYKSDGISWLMSLVEVVEKAPLNNVMLIDDIDNHVNFRTQEILIDTLSNLRSDLQFIVTAHSPNIYKKIHSNDVIELFETPKDIEICYD
jgi:predicted ATP-binding protein involved in virulence